MEKKLYYGKTELAMKYYPDMAPDNARRRMMKEIHDDQIIMRRLRELKYRKTQKVFTYKQMKVIEEEL